MRAHVINVKNVGMIQCPSRSRLLFEQTEVVQIAAEIRGQDLDRNLAPGSRILGPVHFPHAARAQRRRDFITANFCGQPVHTVPDYML